MLLGVTSEIGRLRKALIHEPGLEVDRMVPAMMEQLLFDDILYGNRAREEFGRFRRVLQLMGVEVFEAADLLVDALATREACAWVIEVLLEELAPSERGKLGRLSPQELVSVLAGGIRQETDGRGIEADELYSLPPLPNWCFQRDPQIVLGDGVVFCSMAAPARHREALLARAIFRHHPDLRSTPVIFDPIEADREHPLFVGTQVPHLEGGDLLVFSRDLIAVGMSERTNRTGIKHLARALARRSDGPRWLLVVQIPRRRAYMHLDTLITQVDRNACLVYPPVILPGGREEAQVYRVDLRSSDLSFESSGPLLDSLAAHGVELEPIPCGGSDSVSQQREQWTDGANAFALAPGVITLYDRNVATAETLAASGFRVIEAEDLLLGREELNPDDCGRVCVLVSSHEMSRARGGPHCLVHPLLRDRVEEQADGTRPTQGAGSPPKSSGSGS
jgi:arginine deiminase